MPVIILAKIRTKRTNDRGSIPGDIRNFKPLSLHPDLLWDQTRVSAAGFFRPTSGHETDVWPGRPQVTV
jgi:hypothetical protein